MKSRINFFVSFGKTTTFNAHKIKKNQYSSLGVQVCPYRIIQDLCSGSNIEKNQNEYEQIKSRVRGMQTGNFFVSFNLSTVIFHQRLKKNQKCKK